MNLPDSREIHLFLLLINDKEKHYPRMQSKESICAFVQDFLKLIHGQVFGPEIDLAEYFPQVGAVWSFK